MLGHTGPSKRSYRVLLGLYRVLLKGFQGYVRFEAVCYWALAAWILVVVSGFMVWAGRLSGFPGA